MSQQYLNAQDEERNRFAMQWDEIDSALMRVVTAVESKFDELQNFRASVVEAIQNMSRQNDIRQQEILSQESKLDEQQMFRVSVVEALQKLMRQNDIRHQEILQQVFSSVRPQESVNPYAPSTNIPAFVPVELEEDIPSERPPRVRIRETEMPDASRPSNYIPFDTYVPPKIDMNNDRRGLPSALPTALNNIWENAADLPWITSSMSSRETRLHKLNPPPKFEPKQLDSWFRHMKFWRELYRSVDETQIQSAVGLSDGEDARDLLMDYLDETKDVPHARSLNGYLDKIHKEFGQIHEVERMDKMQEILNFRRKSDMNVRTFWLKMNRSAQYAKHSSATLPGDKMFTQTLYSLMLPNAQKHLVLSHFENSGNLKNIANLRAITIKLFESYQSTVGGVLVVGEDTNRDSENSPDDASQSALVMGGKPKKKTRPGYEEKAAKRSTNVLGFPNGKSLSRDQVLAAEMKRRASTGSDTALDKRCLRSGSEDHFGGLVLIPSALNFSTVMIRRVPRKAWILDKNLHSANIHWWPNMRKRRLTLTWWKNLPLAWATRKISWVSISMT